MPRKNPLSTTDLATARRLMQLREAFRFSREQIARSSSVEVGVITRVELGLVRLKYRDARQWLQSFGRGNFLAELSPINPLWLAEGIEPVRLRWPLFLADPQVLGLNPNVSFSQFIAMFHRALVGLCKYPPDACLPESWLAPYLDHLVSLVLTSERVETCTRLFETSLLDSAKGFGPESTEAARVLTEHQKWKSTEAFRTIAESRRARGAHDGENSLLTYITSQSNTLPMQSEIARLVQRLHKATAPRGKKAELARTMNVDPPRISEWLSGRKHPSGETTLRLLQWVEQQERQQKKSPGTALTDPEPKTQSKALNEKIPKSGRNKE